LLEQPARAIGPKHLAVPKGIVILVRIGRLAAGAVLKKILIAGELPDTSAVAARDINLVLLAAGLALPRALGAQSAAMTGFELRRRIDAHSRRFWIWRDKTQCLPPSLERL